MPDNQLSEKEILNGFKLLNLDVDSVRKALSPGLEVIDAKESQTLRIVDATKLTERPKSKLSTGLGA